MTRTTGERLAEFASTLDETGKNYVPTVATLGDLPAAADNTGREYRVTVDGVYQSNGTDWLPVGTVYSETPKAVHRIFAAIRNDGDQSDAYNYFRPIIDGSHDPQGLFRSGAADERADSIETLSDRIRVHHALGANRVGTFVPVIDETLAKTGISLGASVGVDSSDIYIYRRIAGTVNRSGGGSWAVSSPAGLTSATWNASGYVDIVHDACPGAAFNVAQIGTVEAGEWIVTPQQISSTQTRLRFHRARPKVHSARVYYDGATWQISGADNATLGTTGSGLATVNFTDGDVRQNISVLSRTAYAARLGSYGPTSATVKFYNAAGTQVVADDTSMDFLIAAESRVLAEQPPASTSFTIEMIGTSPIDPRTLTATGQLAGSNLWISGDMVRV